MKQTNRRNFLRKGAAVAAAAAGAAGAVAVNAQTPAKAPAPTKAGGQGQPTKRVLKKGSALFNATVAYGNLVFIAGVGYHQAGDIKVHTQHVLDDIKTQLESAGSSMDKVLKCNVYLNDLKDYDGMNEVYSGKFGAEPPARTTIAAAGGIPGNSLVEIDVIAYI